MHHLTRAVIFDMDGVIIDSEPLWRKAMIKGFSEYDVAFTEDDCRKTTGMRLNEVIHYWHKLFPDKLRDKDAVKNSIINDLIILINQEGKAMSGLLEILNYIKQNNIKIGLSTSSDHILIETILSKLEIIHFFDEIISAQHLKYGKPHPEVYLVCAEKLNIHPMDCMVIEDSINGIVSAKAAQMNVIAIPDREQINNVKFNIADGIISHLSELKDFIILN
jgi:HAD superfamily hydrolase (TIGR01509 family)